MKAKVVNITYLPSDEERDSSKQLQAGGFLWPGFAHAYPVFAKQIGADKWRYQTGLIPEEAPADQKEEIAQALEDLEKYYGKGVLSPLNRDFWKDIYLKINKKNIYLNVTTNPEEKLLYYVIKGGGIFEVAGSFDEAKDSPVPKKWFLVEPDEYAEINATSDRTINKAIAALEDLDENQTYTDMFLVHKVLVSTDRGTTKQTPRSALYKDLSDFIQGKLVKTDKRKTPKQFVETYNLIKEGKKKLFVTAYVRDAVYFNFIVTNKEDNILRNIETQTKYGASIDKVIDYISNPANQDELDNIKEKVEKKWAE